MKYASQLLAWRVKERDLKMNHIATLEIVSAGVDLAFPAWLPEAKPDSPNIMFRAGTGANRHSIVNQETTQVVGLAPQSHSPIAPTPEEILPDRCRVRDGSCI
jgi:hypothetical protein